MSDQTGIVYVLTNRAMEGIIKIGLTTSSVEKRMLELDTTALPLPFECFYAARVLNPGMVEKALHIAFGDTRVRSRREFFRIDPTRVVAVLELLAMADETPRSEVVSDEDSSVALLKAERRRAFYTFPEIGIPIGSMLIFSRKTDETCVVTGDRTVLHRGIETTLSGSAKLIMTELGYNWSGYHGQNLWLYGDDSVLSLREEITAQGLDL